MRRWNRQARQIIDEPSVPVVKRGRTGCSLLFSNGVRAIFYNHPTTISNIIRSRLKLDPSNVGFAQFTREFGIEQLTLVKVLVGNSKMFLVLSTFNNTDRPHLFNYIAERDLEALLLYAAYYSYGDKIYHGTRVEGVTLRGCIREGMDPALCLLGHLECWR
jgi:hypothetical protein